MKVWEIPKVEETEIRVCKHCDHEIDRVGPDSLDYCEPCHLIEGPTETITESEYERRHS